MILMGQSDYERVQMIPEQFMLSFLSSVVTESLKAKQYAMNKIEATKIRVQSDNCGQAEKQRLVYSKFLQKIKSPLFEVSADGATLSRKRMSVKAVALSSTSKPLCKRKSINELFRAID